MKPIGQTFSDELKTAGLDGLPVGWGRDGVVQVHDQQNRLVKVWKDNAGAVQESRTADLGTHPQVTDGQITAIKNVLASHNETTLGPDPKGFELWLCGLSYALKQKIRKEYGASLILYLREQNWPEVEADLSDAKTNLTLLLTAGQWNALRAAALTTYRLPVTLP